MGVNKSLVQGPANSKNNAQELNPVMQDEEDESN
jgi:hypothetical protein